MYNWNTVHVRYCDGSSYAGDTSHVYENSTLHFRGKNNRDSTIRDLIDMGVYVYIHVYLYMDVFACI
jgi:hypothetical protein